MEKRWPTISTRFVSLTATIKPAMCSRVTAADRLAVSFVVSAITAVSFGLVRPSEAFLLTNVCLWIAAIVLVFSITTRITKSRVQA